MIKKLLIALGTTLLLLSLSVFGQAFTEYLQTQFALKTIMWSCSIIICALIFLGIVRIKDIKLIG